MCFHYSVLNRATVRRNVIRICRQTVHYAGKCPSMMQFSQASTYRHRWCRFPIEGRSLYYV